jgi:pantothenate kinase
MDGFHYSRAQLDQMPDPKEAHWRRGAAFTFDASAVLKTVKELRQSCDTVLAPSFDHALKDPVADDIKIPSTVRVVIAEGNYLALNIDPWNKIENIVDELWFADVDFAVARKRLVGRHVRAGICPDEESAGRRADGNDLVNGKQIVDNKVKHITEIIKSVEDDSWTAVKKEKEIEKED